MGGGGDEGRGRGAGAGNPTSYSLHPKSLVALDDKFVLASGLMEITYNTGAKVILQGPVTYQVESNGGYLAVGKLTGKLAWSWDAFGIARIASRVGELRGWQETPYFFCLNRGL